MVSLIKFFHYLDKYQHWLEIIFVAFLIFVPLIMGLIALYGKFLSLSWQTQLAERILSCMETYLVSAFTCTQLVK